jgi:hypothetical protein
MNRRIAVAFVVVAAVGFVAPVLYAGPANGQIVLAQQAAAPAEDDSPQAKMNRRFPQKARVGDLIGLPILDDNDVTLGRVQKVVRTPAGKIELIVSYSKWFGWFGRPVAVPIEVVAILARQIASLDMEPSEYEAAPTWSQGNDQTLPDDETIRIAITRR